MAMIAEGAGTQFDPTLVAHFLDMNKVIKKCLNSKEQILEEKSYFLPSTSNVG